MGGGGAEQVSHCFCRLLAGQPRHLDLAAEELVFQVNRQRSPPRWAAASRFPMASTTLTVTPFPACL